MYVDRGGCLHVAKPNKSPELLTDAECRFSLSKSTFKAAACRDTASVDVAIFERARDGCRCFWSVESLHAVLNLSQGDAKCGVWRARSIHSWEEQAISRLGCPRQVLRARTYGSATPEDSCGARVLEFTSFGSVYLTYRLMVWSFLTSKNMGAFEYVANRNAADAVMQPLLAHVGQGKWNLMVVQDELEKRHCGLAFQEAWESSCCTSCEYGFCGCQAFAHWEDAKAIQHFL